MISSLLRSALVAFAAWLTIANSAWAQPPQTDSAGKSYVLNYLLVVLCVVLGLLVVLRPTRRSTTARPKSET
jgi:hypothetical protein